MLASSRSIYLLIELALEGCTLLMAEVDERTNGGVDSLACHCPLLGLEDNSLDTRGNIGHAEQRVKPVLRLRNTCLGGNVSYLVVIVVYEGGVDGGSVGHLVLLNPDREVDLAPDQFAGKHLSYLHLLLAIEWRYTGREVHRLAVQRLHLDVDFLFSISKDCLSVARH